MIGFDTIRERLLTHVRHRIQNGEATERGLARRAGIYQPHLHNLLKGIRSLNARTSDQLLAKLGLSVPDLLENDELRRAVFTRAREAELSMEVPVLYQRLGPGLPWPDQLSAFERIRIPLRIVGRMRQAVVARLSEDPDMADVLSAGDLMLLDSSRQGVVCEDPDALFAVESDRRIAIRWIRHGRACLYLIRAAYRDRPRDWELAPRDLVIRAHTIPLRSIHDPELVYDPLLPRDIPRAPVRPSVSS